MIESLIFNGKRELLEKFLKKVERVINCGGTLKIVGDSGVQTNVRYALVNEFLLWQKWWGFAASLPIYRLCFELIYYGGKNHDKQKFENFSAYDKTQRRNVVKGLFEHGEAGMLDEYCRQVQSEIRGDCYRKYLRYWGTNALVVWVKEFAMWQRLGFDFASHAELSLAIVNSFVQREDASHLASLLQTTGFVVPSEHRTKLYQFVFNTTFKKDHTREMFFNVIQKHVAVS